MFRKTDDAIYYPEIARLRYGKLGFAARGWVVNEIIRNITGKNICVGIRLGTDGVWVALFKTRYETDFYEKTACRTSTSPIVSPSPTHRRTYP